MAKKKKDVLEVRVNINNLTIGDLEKLDRASTGEMPLSDMVEFLDKVVEGDVRELPVTAIPSIVSQLTQAITGMMSDVTEGN